MAAVNPHESLVGEVNLFRSEGKEDYPALPGPEWGSALLTRGGVPLGK